MKWDSLPETVCRMDAASERTWMYLQRVSGNGSQFMSRMILNKSVVIYVIRSDSFASDR